MVMRLYLDGCSLTYGQGLEREQSLGRLFADQGGYIVTDNSSPGKSNMTMAVDAYENRHNHDVFVLGWTFASRFGLRYRDQELKFFAGHGREFGLEPNDLDLAHQEVQKYWYTVFESPWSDRLSDMLVDSTVAMLRLDKKTVVAFSWEPRDTDCGVLYPYVPPCDRLDDGHLTAQGTQRLFHYLQNQFNV